MSLHIVDEMTLDAAHRAAVYEVLRHGIKVANTIELDGLLVSRIARPYANAPLGVYSLEYLEEYVRQMIYESSSDFTYTYGNRLRRYGIGLDQLDHVVHTLTREPESRRAVAVIYDPEEDMNSDSVPCMNLLDFKIRNERLHLTAYFRSHDVYAAYPANIFALARLMEYVIAQIDGGRKIRIGTLNVVSNKAHIYQRDEWDAWKMIGRVP